MDPREEFLKQTESRMLKLGSDLTMIRARHERSRQEVRLEEDKPVDELNKRYTQLRDRLHKLKVEHGGAWSRQQTELERDLIELQRSVNDVGMWIYTRSAR